MLGKLGIPGNTTNIVAELILDTKHNPPNIEDIDTQVLLDADLAILDTTPKKYQQYARAIRQEYSWVAQKDYICGRQQILEQFCQRQQIYLTPLMLEECEDSARINIKMELESLQNCT
ncbi:hypothetical protein RintRC_3505 [Richelia intracellularis]|nr:hypothetical protein RintRC_3505 [Richelia intracellularis]